MKAAPLPPGPPPTWTHGGNDLRFQAALCAELKTVIAGRRTPQGRGGQQFFKLDPGNTVLLAGWEP